MIRAVFEFIKSCRLFFYELCPRRVPSGSSYRLALSHLAAPTTQAPNKATPSRPSQGRFLLARIADIAIDSKRAAASRAVHPSAPSPARRAPPRPSSSRSKGKAGDGPSPPLAGGRGFADNAGFCKAALPSRRVLSLKRKTPHAPRRRAASSSAPRLATAPRRSAASPSLARRSVQKPALSASPRPRLAAGMGRWRVRWHGRATARRACHSPRITTAARLAPGPGARSWPLTAAGRDAAHPHRERVRGAVPSGHSRTVRERSARQGRDAGDSVPTPAARAWPRSERSRKAPRPPARMPRRTCCSSGAALKPQPEPAGQDDRTCSV